MSSNSNHNINDNPVSDAVALGGPVELNPPAKPPITGRDRNRLKQIEKEINESIRRNRVSATPNRLEIEL